ncbi:MAG: prolipoprotein diacylglyceryl transferase family protein [Planctomycetota bacterium]
MSDQIRIAYAITMACALGIAWRLLRTRQSRLDLPSDQRIGIAIGAFVGAMIGAKMPFVLEADWESLRSGTIWLSDGKTILGGIFGGYLAVEVTKWCMGITTKTGDAFAVPIAVAVAIGRIACFIAGCCFGIPTQMPWGVEFPSANDPSGTLRHPTQLYEVAFHLTAAALLWLAEQRGWLPRQRLKAYLLAYLTYRFVSEWLRPEPTDHWGLTAYQIACVILGAVLAVLWAADAKLGDVSDESQTS